MSSLNSNEGHELDGVAVQTNNPHSPFIQWMERHGASIGAKQEPPDFPDFGDAVKAAYDAAIDEAILKHFVRFDGFRLPEHSDSLFAISESYSIVPSETHELTLPALAVRVLISSEAKKEDVLALLTAVLEMREWEPLLNSDSK